MKRSGAQCRVFNCNKGAYTMGGLCSTHGNMATIIRAARTGHLPLQAQEYFLAALREGYGCGNGI